MAKHLNVSLTFNADTEQAKKKIQELQASLQSVAKMPGAATELFDDASIQKASQAALELERHLAKAVNVDTGKLDLSRFSQSLKASGKDLNSYCNTLLSIGPTGQQAFLNLAQAIATADTPVTRVNSKLKELGTTLANTARWQISSSILHGFMGAIQSAYGYAQDLNESLNDIRIVTGKSTDEMARFAKQANDAAKALSTTTNEYTEASLIYFQQGDDMAAVEEKAAITVKMAQVTGQSMETVSDQMTAVWNNFYDGSVSLEHYADAMARLGAITASSSDEIAQGLEKFASVADMIGLGFDEAAAALTTVTANTRQSADIVGTAFKTIFARIQGLNLGETLEDGTTLNKYSEALNKVGINIKDTSGQMKDMNTILNEMGAKWDTLSKDQQVALAQTVAGVRQYGQLVSLMENFDDYQANLTEAKGADGELAAQSAIYAEGWEAARDRVQAALEGVYDSLINDEFFIDLLNGLEKVIKGVEAFIDTFGGLGGILQAVGGIFMTMYANKMPEVMNGLTQNIRTLTGQAKKDMEAMQIQMGAKLATIQADPSLSEGFKIQAEGIEKVNIMKQKLVKASETLTAAEREEYEARIRNVQAMYQDIDALVKKKEAAEKKVGGAKKQVVGASVAQVQSKFADFNDLNAQATRREAKVADLNAGPTTATNIAALEQEEAALEKIRNKLNQVDDAITQMAAAYGLTTDQVEALVAADGEITPDIYAEIQSQIDAVTTSFSNLITRRTALDDMTNSIRGQINSWNESSQKINEAAAQLEALGKKGEAQKLLISHAEQMKKKMEAYLTAVAKVARDKGLDSVARRAEAAKKKIENMKAAMMVKKGKVDLGSMISTKEFDEMMKMAEKSLNNLDSQIDRTRTQMGQMQFDPAAMQELEKSAEEAANANVDLTNALENTNQQAEESPQSSFKMSEALTSLGGVAMSTMAAITTLKNGFETIFNPDASGLEKAMAVVSMFTGVLAAYNAAIAFGTVLKKIDTSAETTNMLAKAANAVSSKVITAVCAMIAAAKGVETGAVVANTAAWYANPIMWIALIIMAVIAAMVALVAVIVKVSEALKAMDSGEKLKAAEAEAARMAEELNKARQAAEDLRNSIDKYDSAVDKMKTLTEGTAEYRAALDEANAEARKLIDENSSLEGKYHFNVETGLIEFDDGALEEAQAQADQRTKDVQSAEIASRSNVLDAKNKVLTDDATKKGGWETTGAIVATVAATSLASMVPVIGPMLTNAIVGGTIKANVEQKANQEEALNKLAEAYAESDNNMAEALASLSADDQDLIKQLDMADNELSALVTELAKNNEMIAENNKQLVHANFSDKEAYAESSNKEFLAETMGADIAAETDRLYEEQYKDGAGMKDKDAQRAYAEMMGWDPDKVKNKGGNKAVYIDNEGNEVELDDATARKYLAQQEAIKAAGESLDEHAAKVEELEKQEQILAKAFEDGAITYDEYTSAVQEAGEELGFTSKEMDKYTKTYGSDVIKRERKEQDLTSTMSKKLGMGDNSAKQFVDEITKDMTDEQLDIALDVAATAESLDDFKRQFQHAATDALISSIDASQANVTSMLATADENGKFSSADLASLETDDNFTSWLEQNNKTMRDLTSASYSEQYNIISQFYSDLQRMESENLELQKQNYQDDLAEYQAIMDYKMAQEEGNAEAMKQIQDEWGTAIDFEAYMDLNTEDIQTKLDEVANRIKEITDQKYEIDMSWDGIDQLEGAMDELSGVTKMMEKDARKVGDSYMITAAQGREWMEMYPELFENAEVTTDGLIKLSEADYEAFKEAQDGEREAAIDTEIQKLEARLAELDAEEKAAQAELDLVAAIEEGKVDYNNASAESIASTRQNLTQFYIDSGYDEVAANQMALEQMGLTQEQYNQLVADSTEANAKDMATGAQSGAEATRKTYSSLAQKLKDVFSNIGKAIKAVFTGNWDDIGGYFSAAWDAAKGEIKKESTTTSASDKVKSDIGGKIEKYQSTAVLAETRNDAFATAKEKVQGNLDKIAASRQNINNQITYLSALKNQGIEGYGNTDAGENKDLIDEMVAAKERYHELTREAEALERAVSEIEAATDRAFGADKVKLMNKQGEALEKLKEKQEALLAAQKFDLINDQTDIIKKFEGATDENGAAMTVDIDADGNISNYTDLVAAAQRQYNEAIKKFNESGQTDADKEALEEAEEFYDAQIASLEQYEETLDATNESAETVLDTLHQIQDLKFEELTTKMELQMEVNDSEMETIGYYLEKYANDFYKMAESAVLIGQKMDLSNANVEIQKTYMEELDTAKANGEISDADYGAARDGVIASIRSEMSALMDLDNEMQEYYGNTLSMAQEEIGKYTDKMDHLGGVLDHYQSMLSIIGKETDYKSMGIVLQGIADNMANQVKVAEEEYAFYKGEADKKKALMDSAINDPAAFEVYKKEWEAAEAAAREAQENMLSRTEEWAESMKSVIQNKLSDFASTLEDQLTGGTSFDEMTTSIERAASLQEEYLTTTNQIYETTKMMRTAEKALDETTSTAAKNKLKGFIETTKQLQNQGKLSQFELDTQQAKYDLLLAEIALEEAQNAKSTVRLQRDAEGNFGYVYTADANQVADAQQAVDDAENALYNKQLEGANDYAQKYQQTLAESQDAVSALTQAYFDGEIATEEEYLRRMEETKAYYQEKLQGYSDLYKVATAEDSAVVSDAWSTSFMNTAISADEWAVSVAEYSASCGEAFLEWEDVVAEVEEVVGDSLTNIADNVNAITAESDALTTELTEDGGVIDALGAEVNAVSAVTDAYAKKRESIQATIRDLEAYVTELQRVANAEKGDFSDPTPDTSSSGDGENSGDAAGFDTGGYTGEWGPSGKLAVLHQKELVLNATDTANLLSVVDMIRALDMHAMSAQIGGILSTPGFHGGESGNLEQNVKIEASFPNVQDRNEIEEAFNNLINRASQYANRG